MSFYDVSASAICGKRLKIDVFCCMFELSLLFDCAEIFPRKRCFSVIVAVFRGKRSFRVLFLMRWQMCLCEYTVVFGHGSVGFVDILIVGAVSVSAVIRCGKTTWFRA